MKAYFSLLLLCLFASSGLFAQVPGQTDQNPTQFTLDDDVNDEVPAGESIFVTPVDDVVARREKEERAILPYESVRESDVMWSKRIWRVLDVREKINLPFANPDRPLITILMEAAERKDIQLYGTLDDRFTTPLTEDEKNAIAGGVDTVQVIDPETYDVSYDLVPRELNPADVKRFRIKEVWFIDRESSTMKVRILGIAPLKDEYDELGNFLYELPLFWVYYPGARQVLANENAYAYGNDSANRSWEDIFEARFFNSYIIKESNVQDRRIEGYLESGRERLMEADRIKSEIFNKEHDLWSY